jgi:hypothetical protein
MSVFGRRLRDPRVALLATLAITWLNYLLTSRWAHVPGSIHGAKEPWFVAALIVATLAALAPSRRSGASNGS